MPKNNLAARAGRWSAQHRKRAILGWILFVVLATVIGGAVGQRKLADEDMGNGESRAADQAVADAGFPKETGEQVLVRHAARADRPRREFTAAVGDVVTKLKATPHVKEVESPYAKGNEGQLSRDGRSALVTFKLAGEDDVAKDRVDATLAATAAAQDAHPDLRIEQFGDASADKALSAAFDKDFKKAEFLSLPITLVILILAFGSLVAAGLPLLLALTAVMGTIGLLGPVSQIVALDEAISSVVLLVGLAVGVDYCMFYLRREMEERDAGKGAEAALEAAAATSGRAVLISGFTVIVAMAGMFLAGTAVFLSFGVGTILVVAVAVLGSVTVLPAMLSWLGQKGWTEKGRVPYLGGLRHRNHGESRVWGAILDRVLKRPVVVGVAATPADRARDPRLRHAHDQPGRRRPAAQPADHADLRPHPGEVPGRPAAGRRSSSRPTTSTRPRSRPGSPSCATAAAKRRASASRSPSTTNPRHDLEVVNIPLAGDGTDAKSEAALATLRDDVIPQTIGGVPRRRGQRDRHDRRLEGLQRHDQVAPADRVRVRARARVHPAARHVPVDRDPDQGDRAQPAVGRRAPTASSRSSSRTGTARACSTSTRSAGSRRGCRCSCS